MVTNSLPPQWGIVVNQLEGLLFLVGFELIGSRLRVTYSPDDIRVYSCPVEASADMLTRR